MIIKKIFCLALCVVLVFLFVSASVSYADSTNPYYVDPPPSADLPSRLGMPSQPMSNGDTYSPTAGVQAGLNSCGDIGISTEFTDIVALVTSILKNSQSIQTAGEMALLAYALPTEYSVVTNIGAQAIKYLQILNDRCRVFQETQKFLERTDIAGIQSAARAKCLAQGMTEVQCSDHYKAWFALWGDYNCHSLMHEALQHVSSYPAGLDEPTITKWFGDINLCPNGSQPVPATTSLMNSGYSSMNGFYTTAVNNIITTAQSRTVTDSDVMSGGLCIGAVSSTGSQTGSNGVLCPSSQVINKIAAFPVSFQTIFKAKLASILTILELDYWNNQAAYLVKYANQQIDGHKGVDTKTLPNLVDANNMRFANYKDTLVLAHGQSTNLDNFEKQVYAEDKTLGANSYEALKEDTYNSATSLNANSNAQNIDPKTIDFSSVLGLSNYKQ